MKEGGPAAPYFSLSAKPVSRAQRRSLAVVADGVDWASVLRLHALLNLFSSGGLFEDIGITCVVLAGEEVLRRLATEVAVDALGIHVELSRNVLGAFIVLIGHGKAEVGASRAAVKSPSQFGVGQGEAKQSSEGGPTKGLRQGVEPLDRPSTQTR